MKNLYLFITLLCITTASVFGQTPEKLNYQAIVRNSSDLMIQNQNIGIQISILKTTATGTAVYVETQTPTTNTNGLISIEIGSGSVVSGDFTTIDWGNDIYFIKTEIDVTGGTSYSVTGTSQLMSVPYALHAKTAESVSGGVSLTSQYGDIKTGIQSADHNGWLLLDGRALSSLTTTQQAEATALGLAGNLPDGRDKYLSYSPAGNSTFGSNTINLTRANLPTDTFSGETNFVDNNDQFVEQGEYGLIRKSAITDGPNTNNGADINGRSVEPDVVSQPFDHKHNFSLQLNDTQTAIDNKPATLNVRMFIYLGE